MTRKPLEGVKVVEVANWVSGPTCGVMLADYGAEVIKVEHLQTGGDPTRRWIPEIDPSPDLINYVFEQINRGKRSLALDLGSEKGKEIFARLIKDSDVMVTNLRVGTAESLGIDYESLSAINPALVYGRLTAYGIKGPDKDRPGYDMLSYWARSGLMSAISPADGPPVDLPCSLGDVNTGTFLFGAIMMALYTRERTGKGAVVDTSLYNAGIWGSAESIWSMLISGRPLKSLAEFISINPLIKYYQCGDGKWAQLCLLQSDRAWLPFCAAIARPDLAEEPEYGSLQGRAVRSEELTAILKAHFKTQPRDYWAARLDESGLPWEPISSVEEVGVSPQLEATGSIVEVEHPQHGSLKELASPFRIGNESFASKVSAPELGASTEVVLLDLGYSREEIVGLKEAGVVL